MDLVPNMILLMGKVSAPRSFSLAAARRVFPVTLEYWKQPVSVEIARKMSSIVDGYYFMTPFNRVELICNIIERIREENL